MQRILHHIPTACVYDKGTWHVILDGKPFWCGEHFREKKTVLRTNCAHKCFIKAAKRLFLFSSSSSSSDLLLMQCYEANRLRKNAVYGKYLWSAYEINLISLNKCSNYVPWKHIMLSIHSVHAFASWNCLQFAVKCFVRTEIEILPFTW